MRKRTNYEPEFKLSVVKEYLSDDSLTLTYFASQNRNR
ncbi:hypothetical protein X275_11045 [Marinitoga sp. 1197]|nr:hypothetical protein X275_11045 [Marinitoga sp. 1197]